MALWLCFYAYFCLVHFIIHSLFMIYWLVWGSNLKFWVLLHPPGRKSWLLFSVRGMSGGLRNPCFTKFSVVNFLQMACNHRYPTNIENSSTQNTRLIIYFIIVSMNLFEVKMFIIVININYRYLWDVLQLVSVRYVTFCVKLQIITL